MITSPQTFRVHLPAFSGPMDLLLHLIREKEMDIHDIPIGPIAEGFLQHVRAMTRLDMETASEFLLLAATLMEIKVRMLLPRPEGVEAGEEDDPRWELVQKLLEYRRFKDAAGFLESRADLMSRRWPRPAPPAPDTEAEGEPDAPGSQNPWTCFQAYSRLLEQLAPPRTATIRTVEIPLEQLRAEVLALCPESGSLRLSFAELLAGSPDRGRVVGVLLAMLELVRQRLLHVRQEGLFGTVVCERTVPQDAGKN